VSNHAAHAGQNPAGRAAYLASTFVSLQLGHWPREKGNKKKKEKKKRRIVNVDQQQRRRSHGFACGLFCFRRLTVSAQHSLALPETHRNTALHLPVDLSSFFFQHSLTPRSGSHCVCLSLGDLARGKGI
jgi:hypothetical protein